DGEGHPFELLQRLFLSRGLPSVPACFGAPNRITADLDGIVNRKMRQVEAERTLVMTINKVDRVTVDQIGNVTVLPRLFAAVPPVVSIVVTDVADEVNVAAVVTDKFV